MFPYGMTQWVAGDEDLERSFQRLSSLKYDAIEYASDPYGLDRPRCHRLMECYGVSCLSLCGLFGEERDLTLDQAETGVRYLKDSVDLAAELGAKVLIVVPSPVGRTAPPAGAPPEKLWSNAVRNIRSAADYAGEHGVSFAIEPINRYETFLVNSVGQACRMAREIDHPAVGVMADAFHMSLEESDPAAAVRGCGKLLKHVHIADSNRGPAGAGHTSFSGLIRALLDMRYDGAVVMEFMCRSANPYNALEMAPLSEMMDDYARISIDTMRALERAARLSSV